jgi:hypothetical protein
VFVLPTSMVSSIVLGGRLSSQSTALELVL